MSGAVHPLILCRHGLHGDSFTFYRRSLKRSFFPRHLSNFIGAIAKLGKALLASSCLSVRLPICLSIRVSGTTWPPRDGFSWNLTRIFENLLRKLVSIKIRQEWRALYMRTNVYLWSYLAQCFLELGLFQKRSYRGNQNTYFIFNYIFLRKSCCL